MLGVSPDAPKEVIKAAYRALMKKHHPDVGGDPAMAKIIEEAYRTLMSRPDRHSRGGVSVRKRSEAAITGRGLAPTAFQGQYLEIRTDRLQPNQIFPCPRECSYNLRNCRYKQLFARGNENLTALRATSLLLHVRNQTSFAQRMDCLNGKGVLVDQTGDFYCCYQVCSWQQSPKYKETGVELFPNTRATVQLWFPELPPGRWHTRFVYKHKVLVRDLRGDWLDEELIELLIS